MNERREHARFARPLDGRYRGQSGASPCRVTDISWGGCFVQTMSTPMRDEHTVVIIPIDETRIEIGGRVQYVERGMGFAVKFDRLTTAQIDALKPLLGDPPPTVWPAGPVAAQSIGKT
ncbi:MAG TPA: PilZ domain-containing protein [Vicinamibacterales bacterium]|nr:PilZ domain-containing protein [Vicinamibacterales bacterium]